MVEAVWNTRSLYKIIAFGPVVKIEFTKVLKIFSVMTRVWAKFYLKMSSLTFWSS